MEAEKNKICLVYVTNENVDQANQLVDTIINERLAACANMFPIQSAYWWQDAVAKEDEVVALFKTIPLLWNSLKKRIEEVHPYEVPCILKIEAEVNQSYFNWIHESVSP